MVRESILNLLARMNWTDGTIDGRPLTPDEAALADTATIEEIGLAAEMSHRAESAEWSALVDKIKGED